MRAIDGTILIVVLVVTAVVLVLVFRQEMKESKRLAAVARRKGLKFSRKDVFRIRRELNRRFKVKGSNVSFGWVRDIAYDSKIRVFRVNHVHSVKKSFLDKPKTNVTQSLGAVFPGMEGPPLAVETDGWDILKVTDPSTGNKKPADLRSRAVAAYLGKDHAPFPLFVLFADERCFAYLKPPRDEKEYEEGYRYMMDLAERLFEVRMGELHS